MPDLPIPTAHTHHFSIIGGGPAGLMAAWLLARDGHRVTIYEAGPTLGRKFLRAGVGGLNITHSEDLGRFIMRYGSQSERLRGMIEAFKPDDLRAWVHGLGIETFVGTSGRVFPKQMKAAPLLRSWVHHLREAGVEIRLRHALTQIGKDGRLDMMGPDGAFIISPDRGPILLALGGASWPQLGSTGQWASWLSDCGITVSPMVPANCGFEVAFTAHLREKCANLPLKAVALTHTDVLGNTQTKRGELMIADYGIEGSLIYAFSAQIRDAIYKYGKTTIYLDLAPERTLQQVRDLVARPRKKGRSLSRHLASVLADDIVKKTLLFEYLERDRYDDPDHIAGLIKHLPIQMLATRPIAEAISTAGGITWDELDEDLMIKKMPGIFVAGEMADWEAPTGGYLLTACLAMGKRAASGMARYAAKSANSI
ncbi:MAG: TIGR03862 family flavoprotein [Candidatus Melainabacteria bacterium]|nr:TIGR03862 family flavoprotein [Candidatus Melainabacteria bacterium]